MNQNSSVMTGSYKQSSSSKHRNFMNPILCQRCLTQP